MHIYLYKYIYIYIYIYLYMSHACAFLSQIWSTCPNAKFREPRFAGGNKLSTFNHQSFLNPTSCT